MAYADYAYYMGVYQGNSVLEQDFARLSARASAFIDYITMNRAAAQADTDAVKMACCALTEDYQLIDQGRQLAAKSLANAVSAGEDLQSQTVGSWSKSYRSGGSGAKDALSATESAQAVLMTTAQMYLAGTGLLHARGYYA